VIILDGEINQKNNSLFESLTTYIPLILGTAEI